MHIFRRGLSDTYRDLGRWPGWLMLFGGGIAGWFFVGTYSGPRVMAEELQFALATLSGIGVVALVIALFNLAAAPFRLERDRAAFLTDQLENADRLRAHLEGRIADIEAKQPRLKISSSQQFLKAEGETMICGLILSVRNLGERPTATENWSLSIIQKSGRPVALNLWALYEGNKFSFSSTSGEEIEFDSSEVIFNKLAKPISGGEIVGGVIVGEIQLSQIPEGQDVLGQTASTAFPLRYEDGDSDPVGYFPHLKARYVRKSDGS